MGESCDDEEERVDGSESDVTAAVTGRDEGVTAAVSNERAITAITTAEEQNADSCRVFESEEVDEGNARSNNRV